LILPFEKWDATGNDFVLIDLGCSPLAEFEFAPGLIRSLCDRDHGIGADGVVLWQGCSGGQPSKVAIWNADGSPGQMCGNALRCVALVLARADSGSQLSYRVRIGEREVTTRAQGPGQSSVSMGPVAAVEPHPMFASLPILDELLGGPGFLVSFGNPHYVLPCSIPEDWEQRGSRAQVPADRLLGTGGINCGFLQVSPAPSPGCHRLRVFERGAGATKSCGSGACAASAVLESRLGVAPPHRLELPGGVLDIGRSADAGFELSGPAFQEFVGQWSL
jgi:diaminopimelate epimerase